MFEFGKARKIKNLSNPFSDAITNKSSAKGFFFFRDGMKTVPKPDILNVSPLGQFFVTSTGIVWSVYCVGSIGSMY